MTNLFEILLNLFESVIIILFLTEQIEKEHGIIHWQWIILFSLIAFLIPQLIFSVVQISGLFNETFRFGLLFEIPVFMIYYRICTRTSWVECLNYALLPEVIIFALNMIVFGILVMINGDNDYYESMQNNRWIITTILNIIHIFAFRMILTTDFRFESYNRNDQKITSALLLSILSLLVSLEIILSYLRSDVSMLIGISSLLGVFVLLIVIFLQFSTKNQKLARDQYQIESLRENEKSFEQLMAAENKLHEIRHDLKHLVTVLDYEGIDHSRVKEESQKIISHIDEYEIPVLTTNHALNTVINMKKEEARAKEIDFKFQSDLSSDFPMEEYDVYLLFMNLLDNAIVHNGSGHWIDTTIREGNDFILIQVRNAYDQESSSFQSKEHGFGTRTIQNIVNQYHGIMDTDTQNQTYTTMIRIKK